MRRRTRERFGIPLDVPLIGSVGRLAPQKNPLFQLKVFERIKEIIPRAMFLMVGSGELGEEVGAEICRLGLNDSVIRCETSNNTSEIYSALDLLLMPSLFEGLPMVAVEAQCSGLPVLCSDVISNEVKLTDLVERRPLDDSAEKWAINAKYIINNQKEDRSSYAAKIEKAGYSAADTFLRLEKVINGEEVGYR